MHETIKGIKVFYEESGKGSPLILLHGLYFDSTIYDNVISLFSKKHHVFAIDLPMHGQSEIPKKYLSIDDMADILNEFVRAKKLKNTMILAHSGGALIALSYATKFKVKRLFLVDPAGLPIYKNIAALFFSLGIYKQIITLFSYPKLYFGKFLSGGGNTFIRNIFNMNYYRLIKENLKKDYVPIMKKVKCPVILLWGRSEEVFPVKYSYQYKSMFKDCHLKIMNGGHDWIFFNSKEAKKIPFL